MTWSPMSSAATTIHNGGCILFPHPSFSSAWLYELSPGLLTDVTNTGWYDSAYNAIGDLRNQGSVPNIYAIAPDLQGARVRCTGMGIRVTYEGSELNRAGRFWAGLCPVNNSVFGLGTTGTAASGLSSICTSSLNALVPVGSLKGCMTNSKSSRVTDGTFEYNWLPNGVPSYQSVISRTNSSGMPGWTVSANVPSAQTVWGGPYGTASVQAGQNALAFWVEGDTTTAASTVGNTYAVELIWHWEIIPNSPLSVAYNLSLSSFQPASLASALNMRQMPGAGHQIQKNDPPSIIVKVSQPPSLLSKISSKVLDAARDPRVQAAAVQAVKTALSATRTTNRGRIRNRIEL